jgi:hypothetical protein
MKVIETYSHFYGLEFLLVHKPALWQEIQTVIADVDPEMYRNKLSNDKWTRMNFVKERIGVEFHIKKDSHPAYNKHLALYVEDQIDVGVEILPMKPSQNQMSSGISCYEGEFYNIIRQGRGVPAMPLVLIGIDA